MNKKFFIILLLFKINVFFGQSTDQIFIKNIYEEYNKSSKMINKRINKAIKKTKYLKNKDFDKIIIFSTTYDFYKVLLSYPKMTNFWIIIDSFKYVEFIKFLSIYLNNDYYVILFNDTEFIGSIYFYYKKNFNFSKKFDEIEVIIYKFLIEYKADYIFYYNPYSYIAIKNNKLYFIFIDTYIDKNSKLSQIKPLFEKNTVKVYEFDQIKNIPLGSP